MQEMMMKKVWILLLVSVLLPFAVCAQSKQITSKDKQKELSYTIGDSFMPRELVLCVVRNLRAP